MESHGNLSASHLGEDRSRELINIVSAFVVLETFFMILYIISTVMNRTIKAWDVYFMAIAYICQLATATIALCKLHQWPSGCSTYLAIKRHRLQA